MKKYLMLTSLLPLCACFGGGSGGGAGGVVVPGDARAAVDNQTVLQSNGNVTSMASEILVAQDGSGPVLNMNRSGSVVHNGKVYTSYRLDDVNFRVATGANDANLKFHMDDLGKIDSLIMNVGDGNQYMDRNGDTNKFRGIVYEYVQLNVDDANHMDDPSLGNSDTLVRLVFAPSNDVTNYSVLADASAGKCPDGKSCRWDRIDQAFQITSEGKNDDFKYSDFGKLQTTNFGKYKGVTSENLAEAKEHTRDSDGVLGAYENWDNLSRAFDDDYNVFAGGYNVDAVQKRPTETTTFTGKAIGSVYATDNDTHADMGLPLQDDAATLEFNTTTGKETLAMHFDNWYDVTVTKDNNDNTNKIAFDNYTPDTVNLDATEQAYVKFRQDTGTGLSVDNFTTTMGDVDAIGHTKTEGLLDMNYYGISTTEEATGIVRFKETSKETGNIQQEREFRVGYGVKPDVH